MNRLTHRSLLAALALVFAALTTIVSAQDTAAPAQDSPHKQRRSPFGVPRVALTSLPEVQAELKMNDEQKERAKSLHEEFVEDRRAAFEDNSGDWEAMREEIEELSDEASEEILEELEDGQKTRLTEIYVQANGPNALRDKEVMEQLKITDKQVEELETARKDNQEALMDSFQDFQGISDEERREAFADLQAEADARLLKALNDEQREQFSKLGGAELEYDLTPLMPRRGG